MRYVTYVPNATSDINQHVNNTSNSTANERISSSNSLMVSQIRSTVDNLTIDYIRRPESIPEDITNAIFNSLNIGNISALIAPSIHTEVNRLVQNHLDTLNLDILNRTNSYNIDRINQHRIRSIINQLNQTYTPTIFNESDESSDLSEDTNNIPSSFRSNINRPVPSNMNPFDPTSEIYRRLSSAPIEEFDTFDIYNLTYEARERLLADVCPISHQSVREMIEANEQYNIDDPEIPYQIIIVENSFGNISVFDYAELLKWANSGGWIDQNACLVKHPVIPNQVIDIADHQGEIPSDEFRGHIDGEIIRPKSLEFKSVSVEL